MRGLLVGILSLVTATGPAGDSPRGQYEALVNEYDAAYKSAIEAVARATDDQGRVEASLRRPQPQQFAPRFFALAETHPGDPIALDALIWVASKCIFGAEAEKAMGMIARDHARSERLKDFCGQCSRYGEPFPPYEVMLRAVMKDTPHRDVKGAACLALADYLKMAKERTESNLIKIALHGERSLNKSTLENARKTQERSLARVADESAALFRRVIDDYADLRIESNYPQSAAEYAKGELFVLLNLGLGQKAPEIVGKDIHGKLMKSADYRGKVVVLDFGSHRSCGVCRQMYPSLRTMAETYKGKPFALLGISVDDDVNELRSLAEKGEITWPIWWDGENEEGPLARQWVILSMPTFYVLDPKGVIRNKGFLQARDIEATVDMLLKEMDAARP
jgi:peroxiredoxin